MTHAAFNAGLNTLSAGLLIAALVAVKRGRIAIHRALMLAACGVSTLFLASYVVYHVRVGHVRFLGTGWVRAGYLAILLSHVALAVAIVPLAGRTLWLGLHDHVETHRRWARWTWPLWLYVSVTGVVVYVMVYH